MQSNDTAHVGADFVSEFKTWNHLQRWVNDQCDHPAYGPARGMSQLLMADVAARVAEVPSDWMLIASLTLPARVPSDIRWNPNLRFGVESNIGDAYAMARNAFDLDLCAVGVDRDLQAEGFTGEARDTEYGRRVLDRVREVICPIESNNDRGIGLGGLVRYSDAGLETKPGGQVMGQIKVTPIDRRRPLGPAVADPVLLEFDVKPKSKVVFKGEPQQTEQSMLGLDVPSFVAAPLSLYPNENQFADKLCLLTGPPTTMRAGVSGPWHRYKDLFDIYFMTQTCRFDGARLKDAIENNWNWKRIDGPLPTPYDVYGRDGVNVVPWDRECEKLRSAHPQLGRYPSFEGMRLAVGELVSDLEFSAQRTWEPGRGWTLPGETGHYRTTESRSRHELGTKSLGREIA